MAEAEDTMVDLGEDEKAKGDLGEEAEAKMDLSEDYTNEATASSMPSPAEQELAIKKKYGGLLPKKPPLISKDHERAFFDSADWALGKKHGEQPGQKPKSLIESLRPKLQPTQHQPLPARRSLYESSENEDGAGTGEAYDDSGAILTKEETS